MFKFDNPTPVQTPVAIIDSTVIYPCFHLRNDHTDSCYCQNWKVTGSCLFFHNFLTPVPGLKEKSRILPESPPALRIRYHCCSLSGGVALNVWFTMNGMCAKNNNTYTWREKAIIREIATHDLCCCLLPQCWALRTCYSSFASGSTYPTQHSIVKEWVKQHCYVRNCNKTMIITELQQNLQNHINICCCSINKPLIKKKKLCCKKILTQQ